jgi:hypothetical protein
MVSVQFNQFHYAIGAKLPAFYPEYLVTIFQVKVYPAHRKMLFEQADQHLRPARIIHICFKNFYHNLSEHSKGAAL